MRQHVGALQQDSCVPLIVTDSAQPISNLAELSRLIGAPGVAARIGVSARTVERWLRGDVAVPSDLDARLGGAGDTPRSSTDATFIDLFAGIGGIRLGFERAGGQCVFTSEWDKYAARTYLENHKTVHGIAGDIRLVDVARIPDHDVLAAGFPCQPFSLAGVSKKNSLGRQHGFLDEAQGTLFFNVAAIIAEKRPAAFLLENVKNLRSHDGGRTFEVILKILNDLGYRVSYRVIDAKGYVPQHRERIIIVGFRDGSELDWTRISPKQPRLDMSSVLHREDGSEVIHSPYIDPDTGAVAAKYTLSDRLWEYLKGYAAKHKAAGNGFGYGMVTPDSTSRTLSARYYKDGSEILVQQSGRNPRRLTPRECARLMGFSDDFRIPVSDTQAYKQFGNSVAVPVIAEVAREMLRTLNWSTEAQRHAV